MSVVLLSYFASFILLLCISVYHLVVFLERRDYKVGSYYIIFSLYTFFAAIQTILKVKEFYTLIQNPVIITTTEIICGIALYLLTFYLMASLLNISNFKTVFPGFVLYIFSLSASVFSLNHDIPHYVSQLYELMGYLFSLSYLYISITIVYYIVQQKAYLNKTGVALLAIILLETIYSLIYLQRRSLLVKYMEMHNYSPNLRDAIMKTSSMVNMKTLVALGYCLIITVCDRKKAFIESRNRFSAKIKEKTALIKNANRKKDLFLKIIADELKTPLTLINNHMESYSQDVNEDERLEVVKQNLNILSTYLNNYLHIEKISRGVPLFEHKTNTNLSEFMERKSRIYTAMALEKSILLRQSIGDNIVVNGDSRAIDEVISNLLYMAIKNTPRAGEIIISLKEKERVSLSIHYNGPGITQKEMEKIITPHDEELTSEASIEIFIIKNIIDSLKGEIFFFNKNQTESTIVLFLNPEDKEKKTTFHNFHHIAAPLNVQPPTDTDKEEKKQTVMVVDENAQILHLLKRELKEDYNLTFRQKSEKPLRPGKKPDIILAANEISWKGDTPILCVEKPFSLSELKHQLKEALMEKDPVE